MNDHHHECELTVLPDFAMILTIYILVFLYITVYPEEMDKKTNITKDLNLDLVLNLDYKDYYIFVNLCRTISNYVPISPL